MPTVHSSQTGNSCSPPVEGNPELEVVSSHHNTLHNLILSELRYWYPDGCPVPSEHTDFDPYTDSAQVFKQQILDVGKGLYGPGVLSASVQHFRDRILWRRLRVSGARHTFMVVYTTDGMHRMLVLKVPPRKFNGPQQRYEHARRQMTFHDTGDGLYAPGVR